MPKSYSLDLRARIVNAYNDGVSVEELVEQYQVGRSTIYSYINRFRETGSVAPKIYHPGRKKKLEPYEAEVRQVIAHHHAAMMPNNEPLAYAAGSVYNALRTLKG